MNSGRHSATTGTASTAGPSTLRVAFGDARSGASILGRWALFGVLAAAVTVALGTASAAAAPSAHDLLYSIPAAEVPGETYLGTGIAVDNSSSPSAGDVYLATNNPMVVDKFAPGSSTATYLCQITGAGEASTSPSECNSSSPGIGAFESVVGITVDQATGDVYVSDNQAHAIDRFSPAGVFEKRLLNPALSFPIRLAVTATGVVLMPEEGRKRIGAWNPATETLTTFSTGADTPAGEFGAVKGIAIDEDPASPSFSSVYVSDDQKHVVDRFSETGVFECEITGAGEASSSASECSAAEPGTSEGSLAEIGPITVDPTNGHLYVSNRPDEAAAEILEFDAEGNYLDTIGPPGPLNPFGLAVSKETGYLFVASLSNPNEAFVFSPDKPIALSAKPTAVGSGAATFHGTVNPLGSPITNCHFEYVEAAEWEPKAGSPYSHGESVPCEPGPGGIGAGTHPVQVEAQLSGLETGKVYHFRLVASNTNGTSVTEDEFFGAPYASTDAASQLGQHSATLNATINPDSIGTSYKFEYGTTSSYGQSVPLSPADIGDGNAELSVDQAVGSLQLGTTYHFRVVATNAAGTTAGPDRTFTTLPALLIDAQPAASIGATAATLQGYVDPLGSATSYHFEYGTTTAYGSSTATAGAGSGNAAKLAAAELSGLEAGTTYHFRLVADNSNGTVKGPDESFTTEASSCPNEARREEQGKAAEMLQECRAFEQVSPEEKGGAPASAPMMSAAGERVFFVGQGSFAGNTWPGASIGGAKYVAERQGGGWAVEAIQPAETETGLFNSGLLVSLSPDITQSLWEGELRQGWFTTSAAAALYVRPIGGPAALASPVLESALPSVPWEERDGNVGHHRVVAESPDFSHVIYASSVPVIPDSFPAPKGADDPVRLYDIKTTSPSTISLVQVNSAGDPLPCADQAYLGGATTADAVGTRANNDEFNAVSRDGSKIFFTVEPCGESWQVYARVDAGTTVPIAEPALNDGCLTSGCREHPAEESVFAGASEDGSKAFVLSTARLVDEGSQDPEGRDRTRECLDQLLIHGANGCSLYMYDFNRPSGHHLVAVSAGDTSGVGPKVQGVVRSSEDGSHIYFVAQGLLSSEPNSLGQTAQAGADNMYVYDTETGQLSFVAELCSGEEKSGTHTGVSSCFGTDGLWGLNNMEGLNSYVTPNGKVLTFTTFAHVTPDDSNGTTDIYRYDAETGSLARISVGHDGADKNGNGGGGGAVLIPNWSRETQDDAHMMYEKALNSRPMTSDGSTVIFSTTRPLQEGDENRQVDFYLWHDGQVSLISGGKSAVNLTFIGQNWFSAGGDPAISPSGKDVVFATDQGLVPSDKDGMPDIYDVRIDGGFAPPPPPPAACESPESCHGGSAAPPGSPATATDTFAGPGNELHCRKGFKRSHGKCVKVHKHKKRHHKRRRGRRAGFNHGGSK